MPIVENAKTQIRAKPKREPACAANTSSLMSTNPPTAVMMPSVISISPPMWPFHGEQALRECCEPLLVVAVERLRCLLRDLLQRAGTRALSSGLKLFAGFPLHLRCIGFGDAVLRLKPNDLGRLC